MSHVSKNILQTEDNTPKKLKELCAKVNKNERYVRKIISIINEKAPNLLEHLPQPSIIHLLESASLKSYKRNAVIHHQNDQNKAHYIIIRGSVSLYTINSSSSNPLPPDRDHDRRKYGLFLTQLHSGESFGLDLSFRSNHEQYRDTMNRQEVTFISDGSWGEESWTISLTQGDYQASTDEGDVAIVLVIPEKTYEIMEMSRRTSDDDSLDEKIAFLQDNVLFEKWSKGQLLKMACAMNKNTFPYDGTSIVRQGECCKHVWFIKNGKVKVLMDVKEKTKKMNDLFSEEDDHENEQNDGDKFAVAIAELGPKEVFGLVEFYKKSRKMSRNAVSVAAVELYAIQVPVFESILRDEPTTANILENIAQKRSDWESLRKGYALKYPNIKHSSLSKKMTSLSEYSLTQKSFRYGKNFKAV